MKLNSFRNIDITYPVTFYGNEKVIAVAYDTPIPGYDTLNTNSLRLWSAMPDQDIDLGKFNEGDYSKALAARQRALEITQVGASPTCVACAFILLGVACASINPRPCPLFLVFECCYTGRWGA